MFRTVMKVTLGVVAAGVAMTACRPTHMGAAATMGDQRITNERLNGVVAEYRDAYRKAPIPTQRLHWSDPESLRRTVLDWLITFRVADRAAEDMGISASSGEVQAFKAEQETAARRQGGLTPSGRSLFDTAILAVGVPPSRDDDLIRTLYIRQEIARTVAPNLGDRKAQAAVAAVLRNAAKALKVDVNPRYGSYDFSRNRLGVVRFTLSRPDSGT